MSDPIVAALTGIPAPRLRPVVERYFAYRLEGFEPGVHRGLPSRYLTFIISLGDRIVVEDMPGATGVIGAYGGVVSGLHPGPAMIRHNGTQVGVALEITPLGARSLFGFPAAELASTIVEPHEALGRHTATLSDRLWSAASWDERFGILDQVLAKALKEHASPPAEVMAAWRSLVATGGGATVQSIATEVGWSRRHLSERFRSEIGVAPKLAARMLRFENARSRLSASRRVSLAEVAHSAGYFDQAHFTREFIEFAGCSPTRWIAEELPSVQDGENASGAE
jgi:AraC-like DNA-binding protein